MHIAYVINYYKPAYVYGGPARSTSILCETLASLGAEVAVLTTNANGGQPLNVPLGQPVRLDGVDVTYYPVVPTPLRSFFYSPALAKACAEKVSQFDLVVLDTLFTHAMGPAVSACRRAKIPYVVSLRGALLPSALRQKHLKKRLYLALVGRAYLNGAAALHCSDLSEAEAVRGLQLKSPAFVVPNGLDITRWTHLPVRGGLRQRLGVPPQGRLLLFLGRLHRIKRPEIALRAFAACGYADAHLVYAGPDEEGLERDLRSEAEQLDCASRVHFPGLLTGTELPQALADTDLLVMPTVAESFGMAALEAMAGGVPVLVSQGVPVGRWAEAEGAGRVAPGTVEAFAQAIRELLANPEQLIIMGQRGRALVQREFDIRVVARQMLAQYQVIVSEAHG